MKKYVVIFLLFASTTLLGNGIAVSNISYNSVFNELSFDISWNNSYFQNGSALLLDAAWIFVKYAPNGGDNWQHARIVNHTPLSGWAHFVAYDSLGIMVYQSLGNPGTIPPTTITVELEPLSGGYQDFKVFATEMVYVDLGHFNAGDGTSTGRFYANGNDAAPWNITSENAVVRGEGAGEFNQEGSTSTQDISAGFPKGWESIFCMKYKITAQQYVDFLNCLTRTQQENRVKANLTGTTASNKYVMTNTSGVTDRNPIACDVNIGTGAITFFVDLDDSNPPNSSNDGGNIVLNHITPQDILAYMDWSGLRPMSELEYEKFCRGKDMPAVASEYAWGTDTYNSAGAVTNSGLDNEATANVGILNGLFRPEALRAGYAATSTSNRTDAGGTFWGMMDMHNLGEFMYGAESLNFARFEYGDGALNASGGAVQSAWTVGAQLLSSQDPSSPVIEPISQEKNAITPNTRSANMGARGVRRLFL